MKTRCVECNGVNLEWEAVPVTETPIQDGLLRLHDVQVIFVLGCNECSATVEKSESLTRVQEWMLANIS